MSSVVNDFDFDISKKYRVRRFLSGHVPQYCLNCGAYIVE
jgi:hypothetical protein